MNGYQMGMSEPAYDGEKQQKADDYKGIMIQMCSLLRKEPHFKAKQMDLAKKIGVDTLRLGNVVEKYRKTFSVASTIRDGGQHSGSRGQVITLHPHLQYR